MDSIRTGAGFEVSRLQPKDINHLGLTFCIEVHSALIQIYSFRNLKDPRLKPTSLTLITLFFFRLLPLTLSCIDLLDSWAGLTPFSTIFQSYHCGQLTLSYVFWLIHSYQYSTQQSFQATGCFSTQTVSPLVDVF